jgi:hypothetical protein
MSRARRRPILAWVLAVVGAFALGALVTWILSTWTSSSEPTEGTGDGTVDDPATSFAISGDLTEQVAPGILVPLDVSLTNTQDQVLRVSELTVTVTAVDAPRATNKLPCTTDDFVVEQFDDETILLLEPGDTRSLTEFGIARADWPRVGMVDADANQDGCKGATLELGYTATGRVDS